MGVKMGVKEDDSAAMGGEEHGLIRDYRAYFSL